MRPHNNPEYRSWEYKSITQKTGKPIITPTHSSNFVKANKRFKMISTTIISGYNNFENSTPLLLIL